MSESNPSIPDTPRCTACNEPLDEYDDCFESEDGKHITPEDERRYRAALDREAKRIAIRRAHLGIVNV